MTYLLFLLAHLWQSTLAAGVAWLACLTVFKNNSPRIRFGIWFVVSLKFLLPFAVLVEAGRLLNMRPLVRPSQSQQIYEFVSGGTRMLASAPLNGSTTATHSSVTPELFLNPLLVVWALGAAIVFGRWLRHWWTIRSLARDGQLVRRFRGLPVLSSGAMRERQIEPGVFGVFRQSILIPGGMEDRLTEAQLQAVLEHEWNHAQRRDNLTAWVHMMVQAIFWFYPVVWLVGRQLIAEREMACDQAVLKSAAPEDYVGGILSVCKFYHQASHRFAAGVAGANLKTRVESILRNEQPRELGVTRRWLLAAMLFASIAGPALVGLLTAQAVAALQGNSFVGMATSTEKKFEVASIKPNVSGVQGFQLGPPRQGDITIINLPLRSIIAQSFRTNQTMVFGAPDWTQSKRYDIVAKGSDRNATNPQVWEMMRSLLIDRFKLKFHVEDREMAVYALTVAHGGHKMKLGENGRCAEEIKEGKLCGDILVPPFGTGMYNMPIGALITGIGQRAGRPIVDRTQLTGKYDVNVNWLPPGTQLQDLNLEDVPREFSPSDVNLFDALEQQAGLKLESSRAAVPVLIVDSVSEPEPN